MSPFACFDAHGCYVVIEALIDLDAPSSIKRRLPALKRGDRSAFARCAVASHQVGRALVMPPSPSLSSRPNGKNTSRTRTSPLSHGRHRVHQQQHDEHDDQHDDDDHRRGRRQHRHRHGDQRAEISAQTAGSFSFLKRLVAGDEAGTQPLDFSGRETMASEEILPCVLHRLLHGTGHRDRLIV
jgi:hypothetical protein